MNSETSLAILFMCIAAVVISLIVFTSITDMVRYWARQRNIAAHGWPPKHLDADGDPVGWAEGEDE